MVWVLLATVTPFIANILFVFRIVPVLIDLTPIAFTVTGIGLAFAVFHYRLLDIAPIARDIVVDGMKDGMIVLDANRRIVDINRAAAVDQLSGEQAPIENTAARACKMACLIERCRIGVDQGWRRRNAALVCWACPPCWTGTTINRAGDHRPRHYRSQTG
jgi:hypothetical protein